MLNTQSYEQILNINQMPFGQWHCDDSNLLLPAQTATVKVTQDLNDSQQQVWLSMAKTIQLFIVSFIALILRLFLSWRVW